MSKENCEIVRDLLPIYIDNVCSDESRRLVSEHLESCVECKRLYENMNSEIEPTVPKIELDSGQVFRAIKKKWYLKASIIALYFLPVIISLVSVGTLILVVDLSPFGISEVIAIGLGLQIISAILMLNKKWWGCIGGVVFGSQLIYMSSQFSNQVIIPLGIIMGLYYAILGFLIYKKWRHYA